MTALSLPPGDNSWPELPYLGLRRFETDDARLYSGREADIKRCRSLLLSSSVRVLVLQGLSGSGKSSFLRAGLLPFIERMLPQVAHEGIVPVGPIVTASADMIPQIARQVHAFVTEGGGRSMWSKQADMLKASHPHPEDFAALAAEDIQVLLDFLSELNRSPRFEFLIAIDQVEDLWSVPELLESRKLHEDFFALVDEFAEERLNGKLVLTLRTERFGVFASKLLDATTPAFQYGGVNRLCHHYLASPTCGEQVAFVKRPLEAGNPYRFDIEEGLAENIVDEMRQLIERERSEMCVLPLLQVVLARLYIEGRERSGGGRFELTHSQLRQLLDSLESRNSVGLLDAYVKWGLSRAVARAFSLTESTARSLVSQRIEATRWREVLQKFSGNAVGGGRVSLRMSHAEMEVAAKKAECELPVDRMLDLLSSPEVGLLRVENRETWTLRHDLLCLTFDSVSEGTAQHVWRRAEPERRSRIAEAAKYTLEDLFGDDPPRREPLRIAELRFWDHKLLSYAKEGKLFDRLGFDVQPVACDENVTAHELVARMNDATKAGTVYSFPRELMQADEQRDSTEIVVLNLFTGFAVICNKTAQVPCITEDWSWNRFDECLRSLLTLPNPITSYLAEDELAKGFFLQLLDIAKLRLDESWCEKIKRIGDSVEIVDSAGVALVDRVFRERDGPCVAIVTAPTWAMAKMVEGDIKTAIDHRHVLNLLDHAAGLIPEQVHVLRRALLVHNVLNIQWPRDRVLSGELDPLLLRLASIGLFLADCVWANDEAVGQWIRQRWNDVPRLAGDDAKVSLPVFLDTFRRSYRFVPSSEYSEIYFETHWPEACPTTLLIYRRLTEFRLNFHQLCAEAATRIRAQGENVPQDISALVERAHKHAAISNYYDAWRLMKTASDRLAEHATIQLCC